MKSVFFGILAAILATASVVVYHNHILPNVLAPTIRADANEAASAYLLYLQSHPGPDRLDGRVGDSCPRGETPEFKQFVDVSAEGTCVFFGGAYGHYFIIVANDGTPGDYIIMLDTLESIDTILTGLPEAEDPIQV